MKNEGRRQNEEGRKRRVVVGVDGGGTKTLALAEGAEQGQTRGAAGSSNLHAVGFEAACAAIESAIAQAVGASEIAALCLGLAGAGRPQDVERFTAWARTRFPQAALKVVSDAEILLAAGALTGAALALVCGTGSIVYGRTARGELIRAGGWGYLFGDEGSGFAIGAAALRAVTQAHDGRGAPTLLTDLILARRGVDDAPGLVESFYGAPNPRAEIAGLAELVEQAAAQNDALALSLIDEAARELARMVEAVYGRLSANVPKDSGKNMILPITLHPAGTSRDDIFMPPLILSGGVILNGARLAEKFHQHCADLGLQFSALAPVPEPAVGAVLLARQMV